MTASVQLIAALGGGWDVSQLPTPAQVSEKPGTRDYKLRRKKVGQEAVKESNSSGVNGCRAGCA